jgi:hypothetical protein
MALVYVMLRPLSDHSPLLLTSRNSDSRPRHQPSNATHLLERDETGGVGGTNTWATVLDWLARGMLEACSECLESAIHTKR